MMDAVPSLPSPAARPAGPGAGIETAFSAIRIEGGLFPAEFLQRVAKQDVPGQTNAAYGVPPGRTLRDEIGRYWTIAEALWVEYRRDRLREDLPAVRTGVERWLTRLLREVLGYTDLAICPEPRISDRTFPIRHLAHGGVVPVLLTTYSHALDRADRAFGVDGRRRAPHAAMQEYLNAEPAALWGIVANGNHLRLLRDNPSLTRPAYVEVDLERIFEEGLYPDFAALFLMAHASRTAPGVGSMSGCWLERWRLEGAKSNRCLRPTIFYLDCLGSALRPLMQQVQRAWRRARPMAATMQDYGYSPSRSPSVPAHRSAMPEDQHHSGLPCGSTWWRWPNSHRHPHCPQIARPYGSQPPA